MASPFITSEELEAFAGITPGDEFAVAAACDVVRALTEQTITEVLDDELILDGTATDALLLPQLPVTEISEVTEDDDVVDAEDYVLASNGVLLKPGSYWLKGRQNIAVTYSHGYADDEVPDDLKMVALSIASRLLRNTGDISSMTLGSYSVDYKEQASEVSAVERAILAKYRQPQ